MATANLEVQWVHSTIGCPPDQRATIRGLGLRRMHQKRKLIDTPQVRGMINKVSHLVVIVEESSKKKVAKAPKKHGAEIVSKKQVKTESKKAPKETSKK